MTQTPIASIHPTAIIDPAARIDPSCSIGPYCVIQGPVIIDANNVILAQTYITGHTRIGSGNKIGPHACIGTEPQSIGSYPDDTGVVIGDGNTIREFAQIHRSITAGAPTRVGNRNFIMAGGHVAHDCVIGDECILTNGAFISGHCVLGNRVNVSSPVGIHQFVRIGRLALISAGSSVGMDVPPFMIVEGRNTVRALNVIGMRRAGIGAAARAEIKRVYRDIYHTGRTVKRALEQIHVADLCPEAREIVDFCRAPSRRGIMPHALRTQDAEAETES